MFQDVCGGCVLVAIYCPRLVRVERAAFVAHTLNSSLQDGAHGNRISASSGPRSPSGCARCVRLGKVGRPQTQHSAYEKQKAQSEQRLRSSTKRLRAAVAQEEARSSRHPHRQQAGGEGGGSAKE